MQPRLIRYKQFIEKKFLRGLQASQEYTHTVDMRLSTVRRLVFTGMGCSAIVADMIKGFFAAEQIPIFVEVINDYEVDYFLDTHNLSQTLVIISSYSGYSQEPIRAYEQLKRFTRHILFLTSGGELAKIAQRDGLPIIYWNLTEPDREYPLFHAPQFFTMLLHIFHKIGLLETDYAQEIHETIAYIKDTFAEKQIGEAEQVAAKLFHKDIILLASAKWYTTLLKLVQMHLNEIAMAPAHRNYLHEFGHSEIGALTDARFGQAVVVFADKDDDEYTRGKIETLQKLLTSPVPQNTCISLVSISLDQASFITQLFGTLNFMQYVTYFLGARYDTPSRELISQAAGNHWYYAPQQSQKNVLL